MISFNLDKQPRRILFGGVCILLAGAYLVMAVTDYRVSRWIESSTPELLKRATRSAPGSAEAHARLGQYYLVAGEQEKAASELEAAVRLNQNEPDFWLSLADANFVLNRESEQKRAVEEAVFNDPTTPRILWAAANFYVAQGDNLRAMHYMRRALEHDSQYMADGISLCWRATHDVDAVLENALPPNAEAHLVLLGVLVQEQKLKGAGKVWAQLIGLNQKFNAPSAFPYISLLLQQRETAAAERAWKDMARVIPEMRPYDFDPGNLVVNGGFDEQVLNGGFDWTYDHREHGAVRLDSSDFRNGSHSLEVTFDGPVVDDLGLSQFIIAKPETNYGFTASYRATELTTASGVRFEISDPYSKKILWTSEEVLGTTPWRKLEGDFRTPPDTTLLKLRMMRDPQGTLIKGTVWFDDIQLAEKR